MIGELYRDNTRLGIEMMNHTDKVESIGANIIQPTLFERII